MSSTTPEIPRSNSPRSRYARRLISIVSRAALIILWVLAFVLSVTPQGRAATRAALLLPSLIDATQFKDLTAGGDPIQHHTVTLTLPNGSDGAYLDIYAPMTVPPPVPGTREAVLIIAGVGDNRQDSQLVNLVSSFAQSGIVTMTLTTPTLIAYALSKADVAQVVRAYQYLQRWPGVDPRHVGMIGFSAGGGLICLAAAEPAIRDQVAFITLFGSYFNAADLLRAVSQRALTVNGATQPWIPQPLYSNGSPIQSVPIQVLMYTVAPLLPAGEGVLLIAAFRDGTPIDAETLATFSPLSQAVYHLLAGDAPDQTAANMAQLTPAIQELLQSISPISVISQLRAPIYLLHDRNDEFVPFTESLNFDRDYRGPHELVEFSIFQHVEVKSGLGIRSLLSDGARLYGVLVRILSYAG